MRRLNPAITRIAQEPNKSNGRMVRGFAIVAQSDQIRKVEAHTFKLEAKAETGNTS